MKYMILDPRADDKLVQGAEKAGFKAVPAMLIPGIDPSVAGHPDMQVVKIGDRLIVNPKGLDYYKKLMPNKNIIAGKTVVQGKYPEYTAYNVALTKRFALHNFKFTDSLVAEALEENYIKINVKQGYTKCSVLTLPEGIITADKGVVKSALRGGVECVEICGHGVSLTGKDYGFIGGASGYSQGVLFFTGDIAMHPDYDKIKKYCNKKCIEIHCLSNDKLADTGSIIIV